MSARIQVFVGLDYHQAGVQICLMDQAGNVLANSRCPKDWKQIVETFCPHEARQKSTFTTGC
jgi:ribulose kinase